MDKWRTERMLGWSIGCLGELSWVVGVEAARITINKIIMMMI